MGFRVCIHKAILHKNIDFKTDSFLVLFTGILLSMVYLNNFKKLVFLGNILEDFTPQILFWGGGGG